MKISNFPLGCFYSSFLVLYVWRKPCIPMSVYTKSYYWLQPSSKCSYMLLSRKTPRSRTILIGFITSAPMYKFKSRSVIFFRLAFDLNQISSVFAGSSWSRRYFHHSWVASMQLWSFIMVPGMPGIVVCLIIWVSSAYMWWFVQYSSMSSAESSVWAMNFCGPSTDPCGTPQSNLRGRDCWSLTW